MELIPITSCKKFLDFHLEESSHLFSLPPVAWERYLLSNSFKNEHQKKKEWVLNFSSQDIDFSKFFFQYHPWLSLPNLAKMTKKILSLSKELQINVEQDFLPLYGIFVHKKRTGLTKEAKRAKDKEGSLKLRNSKTSLAFRWKNILAEDTRRLLDLLDTPVEFQNWLSKKKLSFSQLRPLKSIENIFVLQDLFKWIGKHNPSQAQGFMILEWVVELYLMGKLDCDPLVYKAFNVEQMLSYLEQKRRPLSFNRDKKIKERLKGLVFPSSVKAKLDRRGDETGIRLSLWVKDQNQLLKKFQQIQIMEIFKTLFPVKKKQK